MPMLANVKIPDAFKIEEEGEERYDMCKAFEDMRLEGFEEGMEKGIRALIQTCKELGASRETIMEKCMEKFELTGEKAEAYVKEFYVG